MDENELLYSWDAETDTWTAWESYEGYDGTRVASEAIATGSTPQAARTAALAAIDERYRAAEYEACARRFELALFGEHPSVKYARKLQQHMDAYMNSYVEKMMFGDPVPVYSRDPDADVLTPEKLQVAFRRFKPLTRSSLPDNSTGFAMSVEEVTEPITTYTHFVEIVPE